MRRPAILLLVLVFCPMLAFGQFIGGKAKNPWYRKDGRNQRVTFFAGGGISAYSGELSGPGRLDPFNDSQISFTLGAQRYLDEFYISVGAQLSYNKLQAADSNGVGGWSTGRNLSFESDQLELAFIGRFYVNQFLVGKGRRGRAAQQFSRRVPFDYYLLAGLAFATNNPRAELDGVTYDLRPLAVEGNRYSPIFISIPVGIGTKIKFGNYVNVGLEAALRFTFTDYIDDVSTVYPDPANLTPIQAALADRTPPGRSFKEPGSGRGNPDINDYYGNVTFYLEFLVPDNWPQKKRKTGRRRR